MISAKGCDGAMRYELLYRYAQCEPPFLLLFHAYSRAAAISFIIESDAHHVAKVLADDIASLHAFLRRYFRFTRNALLP